MAVDYSAGTYYGGSNLPVISKEGQPAAPFMRDVAPTPVGRGGGGGGGDLGFTPPAGSFTALGLAAGSFIPGPGTAIGATVGAVLDLGFSIYGAAKQSGKEDEDRASAERWAEIQNEIALKENARQWRWLEEERNYKYAQDFQKGMWNLMSTDQSLKNNLTQLWRRAA